MIIGYFAGGHPRMALDLPAADGGTLRVEFIIDTGFEGDLVLPESLARQVDARPMELFVGTLADGAYVRCLSYEISLLVDDEERTARVIVLPGRPLLGTDFLRDHLLQIEMTEGGEVTAEPL